MCLTSSQWTLRRYTSGSIAYSTSASPVITLWQHYLKQLSDSPIFLSSLLLFNFFTFLDLNLYTFPTFIQGLFSFTTRSSGKRLKRFAMLFVCSRKVVMVLYQVWKVVLKLDPDHSDARVSLKKGQRFIYYRYILLFYSMLYL